MTIKRFLFHSVKIFYNCGNVCITLLKATESYDLNDQTMVYYHISMKLLYIKRKRKLTE